MSNIVIGIEGLVGAGKTSICREIINTIPNTILFNGGNLYRAIVFAIMKTGKSIEQLSNESSNIDIKEMMDHFNISIKIENNETCFYIGNEKISEDDMQSKEASLAVSTVGGKANNKNLFILARNLIDKFKKEYNVIVAGRSLVTIYPALDYHLFITASLEERIRRKCIQYKTIEEIEEVKENIIKRDKLQEEAGFYKLSPKTIVIDVTECKSVAESTKLVLEKVNLLETV